MDANFLEHPIWLTDVSNCNNDITGFAYLATRGPATRIDMSFLSFLLWKSQSQGWNPLLECSQNHVLKQCGISPDSKWRARLKESLDRWMGVEVLFRGTFYNGKSYESLHFRVLDKWGLGTRGLDTLEVELNRTWIATIQYSKFYRMVPLEAYRLRSPVAARLLELLVKNCGRRRWMIGHDKLAEKLGLSRKAPSYVLSLVTSSISLIKGILPFADFQYSASLFSFEIIT